MISMSGACKISTCTRPSSTPESRATTAEMDVVCIRTRRPLQDLDVLEQDPQHGPRPAGPVGLYLEPGVEVHVVARVDVADHSVGRLDRDADRALIVAQPAQNGIVRLGEVARGQLLARD